MRVLFCNRPNCYTAAGGDTVQMDETKRRLEQFGAAVEVSLEQTPACAGFDVVHIFNIQTSATGLKQLRAAKRAKVPVVVSSIFWTPDAIFESRDVLAYSSGPRAAALARLSPDRTRDAISVMRWFGSLRAGEGARQREMLQEADAVLPNSVAEGEILVHTFHMPGLRRRMFIVPNGIDEGWVNHAAAPSPEAARVLDALPQEFVLEVARVEPVKGQLALIKALRDRPEIPLVFTGRCEEGPYLQACRQAGLSRGNVFFTGPQARLDLPHFFRRAKVHALPSMRESPGLSTLEAAVFGANCVVGVHAPVQEYFGVDAWICDPTALDDVRAQTLAAWTAPRTGALGERVRSAFTWRHAAEATLKAYEHVIAAKGTQRMGAGA